LPPLPAVEIYQVLQNRKITVGRPRPLAAIGGDNGTPFYIKFPGMPPGLQWVFPFTYGFLYPMPAVGVAPVLVDSSLFPPNSQAPPVGTAIAMLAGWGVGAVPPAFSPGVSSAGATLVRWNISLAAPTGSQAIAVRAASPGVTHIADSAWFSLSQAAAAASAPQASILDGGNVLATGILAVMGTLGDHQSQALGPGLNYRGTPGNSMTILFNAGNAGVNESVSLSGFDQ
jgi:hypothetical protein